MKYDMPLSTATLEVTQSGDIGGNGQETIIEVTSDGGQFDLTQIKKTETGFRLEIYGTWEANELFVALGKAAKALGASPYGEED